MPEIINGAERRPDFDGNILVTEENDHEFVKPRPINPLYEVALMGAIHAGSELRQKNIVVAMDIENPNGQAVTDIGVFAADIGAWKLTVNWTPNKQQKLPPGHILVEYSGTEVGMLAPFTDDEPIDGYKPINIWNGNLVSGWYVSEDDLWEACAELIPRVTGKDKLFGAFGGFDAQERKAVAAEERR